MINGIDVTVNRLKLFNLTKTQLMDKYVFFKIYNTKYIGYLKSYVGGDDQYHRLGMYVPTSTFILVSNRLFNLDQSMHYRTIQIHIPKLVLVENYIINHIDEYIKFIQAS
jgi:hypothetical protein